jgi:hypothetical protein
MMRGNSVRLDFPSSLDLLDLVQGVSDQMGRAGGLDDDALHWLNVAVRECVINAISPRQRQRREQARAPRVRDVPGRVGPGSRFASVMRGLASIPGTCWTAARPRNLLKSSGRGILPHSQLHGPDGPPPRARRAAWRWWMVKRAQPQQEKA